MIGIRIPAGGVVLDKRQPNILVFASLEMVPASGVRGQGVRRVLEIAPVLATFHTGHDELALQLVRYVRCRADVHVKYLKNRAV